MTTPEQQSQQMSPEQAVQDPMSYDEVIDDLTREIGQLTVNLKVANLQNQKNTAKWVREKAQYDETISRLSTRLAELEGTDQPTIDTDAAAAEEGQDEPVEIAVGESIEVPLVPEEPAQALPAKPRGRR